MSKNKNGGLDQYGAEPFEQQQFGPAGVEGVKLWSSSLSPLFTQVREVNEEDLSNTSAMDLL